MRKPLVLALRVAVALPGSVRPIAGTRSRRGLALGVRAKGCPWGWFEPPAVLVAVGHSEFRALNVQVPPSVVTSTSNWTAQTQRTHVTKLECHRQRDKRKKRAITPVHFDFRDCHVVQCRHD